MAVLLHAAGALVLLGALVQAFSTGQVLNAPGWSSGVGALTLCCAAALLAWSIAQLRSWRRHGTAVEGKIIEERLTEGHVAEGNAAGGKAVEVKVVEVKLAGARAPCTTGPYAWVRHPMYLAVDLLGIGSTIWIGGKPAFAGALLLIIGGEWRARREEAALIAAFADHYGEYMARVPRLLPLLY